MLVRLDARPGRRGLTDARALQLNHASVDTINDKRPAVGLQSGVGDGQKRPKTQPARLRGSSSPRNGRNLPKKLNDQLAPMASVFGEADRTLLTQNSFA
jgi:hypothetical protein